MSTLRLRLGALALSGALLAVAPAAQEIPLPDGGLARLGEYAPCVLRTDGPAAVPAEPGTFRTSYDPSIPRATTFVVNYTGFTPEAQAAFQRAVDIWAQHIESTVPIEVNASFEPLGATVLGSAGSVSVFANFPGAPLPGTWYSNALADALRGTDVDAGGATAEITARFSSNQPNWYYGLDGNTPPGKFDFVTVVLHELGHGLGFFGSGNHDNGAAPNECDGVSGHGCWGLGTAFPVAYDRFVEDAGGTAMIDETTYPKNSPELGTLLKSTQLWMDGPLLSPTLGGRARLYAPPGWTGGSSFSHWDENSYPPSNPNALMTPAVAPAESHDSPGPATCAHFADTGWPLGPECITLIVLTAGEPGAERPQGALVLEAAAPNPFAGTTTVRLHVAQPQHVEVALYDGLGRRVALLHDGLVPASAPLALTVGAADLPAGVYVLRARGEQATATQRLVRTR